jgi:Flp pilus assembly protein TadG
MIRLANLLGDRSGAAAVEMALVTPLLLILLFGSVELGNYFYNEHKLVKAARDGARYAARQSFSTYSACSGEVPTRDVAGTVFEKTKLMVRKGTLDSTATDTLPNWASATFTVTMSCKTTLDNGSGGNYALGGIYANTSAPTVVVNASLPYYPILGLPFGLSGLGASLNASQSAAVAGL